MNNIVYQLEKKFNGDVKIVGEFPGPAVTFSCEIQNHPDGDSGARFLLKMEGGLVSGGDLEMDGSMEREAFKELLQLIISYLK
jgi:hypothetical protein